MFHPDFMMTFPRSPQPPFFIGWFLFQITYLRDSMHVSTRDSLTAVEWKKNLRDSNGLSSSKSKPIILTKRFSGCHIEAPEPNTDGTQSLPPQVPLMSWERGNAKVFCQEIRLTIRPY